LALTQGTIGAGRVGLKKLYFVQAAAVEKQYLQVVGRSDKTTQTSEVFKQLAGLGPSAQTLEGADADFDDMAALGIAVCKPVLYTKGTKFTLQTTFTDQYGVLKDLQPQYAMAFMHRRNINVADLDNSGFIDTTKGIGTETLYSANHLMGSVAFSNRPLAAGQVAGASAVTLDYGLSPLGIEALWKDIRKQPSARNLPMFPVGKIQIKVPTELLIPARRAIVSAQLAGTNNNDTNVLAEFFADPILIDYYTSPTAWFARTVDEKFHGLFFLEQMPYDIEKLPLDKTMMNQWVGYESWGYGWYDAHGTWGTLGA